MLRRRPRSQRPPPSPSCLLHHHHLLLMSHLHLPIPLLLENQRIRLWQFSVQRKKMANLGAREIYYYPDMKVILIRGKVTDVQ